MVIKDVARIAGAATNVVVVARDLPKAHRSGSRLELLETVLRAATAGVAVAVIITQLMDARRENAADPARGGAA